MKKVRLDIFCAESSICQSRERARNEILAGWVRVNGETVHDPSRKIAADSHVTVERPGGNFVSRGGYKLQHALEVFKPDLRDKVVADFGASTGGFTHCLLLSQVRKVYAVDVGYGQLDYTLRNDDRVVVMERTNVRSLATENFHEKVDFLVMDLSFISLLKVMPVVQELFPAIEGIVLVKPQFEAGAGEQKKGVVRKAEYHISILSRVLSGLVKQGISVKGLDYSPIKGPKGNIEFLLYFSCDLKDTSSLQNEIETLVHQVVARAHEELSVQST